MKGKYRVHESRIRMSRDQGRFEESLNSLEGEVVSIVPSVVPRWTFGGVGAGANFVYVVGKTQ